MIVVINDTKINARPMKPIGPIEDTPLLKYASMQKAMAQSSWQVQNILSSMKYYVYGEHKYTIIDVKVHDLKKGEMPCMDNWHMDCVGRPDEPFKEEVHHLVIFGDCSRTVFIDGPILVNLPKDKVINWNKIVNEFHPKFEILPNTVYTYGRNLHKGMPATKDGRRLLIRITETDKIKPI